MEDPKYLPSHIANYLLWRAKKEGLTETMTPMKLIKLVYFCYAWYLTIYDKKLFSEQIEAWKHGPVIPSIYHEFKRFGSRHIENYSIDFNQETGAIFYPVVDTKDEETFRILDVVWDIYKHKDGWALRCITHEDSSPWKYAFEQGENKPLDDQKIIARASQAIQRFAKELESHGRIQ